MQCKKLIVGFDEAGRGPLAGPVCAASVILPENFPLELLNDSKKLTEKKRLIAEEVIKQKACYSVAFIDHKTIDQINILQASLLAMKTAFEQMIKSLPNFLKQNKIDNYILCGIADGIYCPKIDIECICEPKADAKYPEVMAASILAKTARDRLMLQMDSLYPEYAYKKHKGYPTKEHREICHKIGPSPIQRLTFKY